MSKLISFFLFCPVGYLIILAWQETLANPKIVPFLAQKRRRCQRFVRVSLHLKPSCHWTKFMETRLKNATILIGVGFLIAARICSRFFFLQSWQRYGQLRSSWNKNLSRHWPPLASTHAFKLRKRRWRWGKDLIKKIKGSHVTIQCDISRQFASLHVQYLILMRSLRRQSNLMSFWKGKAILVAQFLRIIILCSSSRWTRWAATQFWFHKKIGGENVNKKAFSQTIHRPLPSIFFPCLEE